MANEFFESTYPVFSGADADVDDVRAFLDDSLFEANKKRIEETSQRAERLGVSLTDLLKIEGLYDSAPAPEVKAEAPAELHVVKPAIKESKKAETKKPDYKFAELGLPIHTEFGDLIHGKYTNDEKGSITIVLDDRGRKSPRRVVPFTGEISKDERLADPAYTKSVYSYEKTGEKYLVQPESVIDEEDLKQIAPEGLKDGQVVVQPLNEKLVKALNFAYVSNFVDLAPKFVPPVVKPKHAPRVRLPEPETTVQDAWSNLQPSTDAQPVVKSAEPTTEAMPAAELSINDQPTQMFAPITAETVDPRLENSNSEAKTTAVHSEVSDWTQPEQASEETQPEPAVTPAEDKLADETPSKPAETTESNHNSRTKRTAEKPAAKTDEQKLKIGKFIGKHKLVAGTAAVVAGGLLVGGGVYLATGPSKEEKALAAGIESLEYKTEVTGVSGLLITNAGGVESPTINYLQENLSVDRKDFAEAWATGIEKQNEGKPDAEKKLTIAPDSFNADSATIELSYEITKDRGTIKEKDGTAVVDLNNLEIEVETTITDGVANAVPIGEKIDTVDDAAKKAYNETLESHKDEINKSANDQAEPAVSKAFSVSTKDELVVAVQEQIREAAGGTKVEFEGEPTFVLGPDDAQKTVSDNTIIKGVDSISIEHSEVVKDTEEEGDK